MTKSCASFCVQILYKNVAHPKLAAYIKTNPWVLESGEYLVFPQNKSNIVGGVDHYLESIEEVLIYVYLIFVGT